ncbi:hypothetical protein C0Q70_19136 [Pomacea canaliculata]|uniref:Uncharacterized protein n=1 Tax=Pomacea canaliculata TaxID=400727 RepID=A0A2T7NIJ0_POMCA|nr:hypothetical protein C0Q70_19136 [Pomacea canaliculata]
MRTADSDISATSNHGGDVRVEGKREERLCGSVPLEAKVAEDGVTTEHHTAASCRLPPEGCSATRVMRQKRQACSSCGRCGDGGASQLKEIFVAGEV